MPDIWVGLTDGGSRVYVAWSPYARNIPRHWYAIAALPPGTPTAFNAADDSSSIYLKTNHNTATLYQCRNPKDITPIWTPILTVGDAVPGGTINNVFSYVFGPIMMAGSVLVTTAVVALTGGGQAWYYGEYNGTIWTWFVEPSLGGFNPAGVGLDTWFMNGGVYTKLAGLLETIADGTEVSSNPRDIWYGVSGLRSFVYKVNPGHIRLHIVSGGNTDLGATASDASFTKTHVRGAHKGLQTYVVVDSTVVGVNGALWLSDNGTSFTQVGSPWHGGWVEDDALHGGGYLIWQTSAASADATIARLYDRAGNIQDDLTGDFWSLIHVPHSDISFIGMGLTVADKGKFILPHTHTIRAGQTALAELKAVYYHGFESLMQPAWLGKTARVKDTLDDGFGKLDVDYLLLNEPGQSQIAGITWLQPAPSTLTLIAKEQIRSLMYRLAHIWDVDIRWQCTDRRVDELLNWRQIKRFSHCWPAQLRAEDETSVSYGDGETILTIPLTSAYSPKLIVPVSMTWQSLAYNESYAPVIATRRNAVPGTYVYDPDGINTLIQAVDISVIEHVIVMASGAAGYTYSHDSGQTYVTSNALGATTTAICLADYSTVLLACDAQLYLSSNGGQTYLLINTHGLVTDTINKIVTDGDSFYMLDDSGVIYTYSNLRGLQRLATISTASLTDLLYADGVLYVSGFTTTPIIMASADAGLTWSTVYTGTPGVNPTNATPLFKLASIGFGVIYAMLFSGSGATYRTTILRSVNWGVSDTWEVLYLDEQHLGDATAMFIPNDIDCSGVNHAAVIGTVMDLGSGTPLFNQYYLQIWEG